MITIVRGSLLSGWVLVFLVAVATGLLVFALVDGAGGVGRGFPGRLAHARHVIVRAGAGPGVRVSGPGLLRST